MTRIPPYPDRLADTAHELQRQSNFMSNPLDFQKAVLEFAKAVLAELRPAKTTKTEIPPGFAGVATLVDADELARLRASEKAYEKLLQRVADSETSSPALQVWIKGEEFARLCAVEERYEELRDTILLHHDASGQNAILLANKMLRMAREGVA